MGSCRSTPRLMSGLCSWMALSTPHELLSNIYSPLVRAAITHPILSGQAYEKINASALQEVIVTDTIPLNPEKDLSKFKVMTVADIFANVIERVHNYKEISSIFFK